MENYDLLASLNVKASTAASSKRGIVIGSGPSPPVVRDDKSPISAIVALRQSQNHSISAGPLRVNRHTSRNQLIGILTENNANGRSATRKKTFCIEPKLHRAGIVGNVVQVQLQRGGDRATSTIVEKAAILDANNTGKQKIPRPANAFMLFANEWRKKLAIENPRESNKDISVRLGVLWKNMDKDVKEKYFALAREVDAEHKRKYPDYVYNPKEARLRKAMREQSRELSRQTILQTAIASATGNTSVGGPGCGSNGVGDNILPSPGTGTTNFLNHPLNCSASVAAATLSSLPGSPSFNAGNRIISPWFPGAHGPSTNHPKPILSPRVMTVAQHQQQQHRTFDKTKEVLRKQAECAGAFTAASNPGYPADFSTHGNPGNLSGHQSSPHETNEYCVIAEFSDGQKWHPYQNGPSPYHSRPGGTLAKMGALHPGMQSANQHAHTGWNQFCSVPLSTVGRTPRHMVFLQEQHQAQHCGFTDEMQMPYMQNKHMDIGRRLHPGYSQQEHQQSNKPQPSAMSPLNMSQLRDPEKTIEDGPRWESSGSGGSRGTSETSMVSLMRTRRENEPKLRQEQDHEQGRVQQQDSRRHANNREQHQQQQPQQRYSDEQSSSSSSSSSSNGSETAMKHHAKKPGGTKQPLPGFHQAFGSTEIGRFSRSEFFANMVGGDVPVNLIPDGFLSASIFPFSSNSQVGICSGNSLGFPHLTTEKDILQQILPEDCIWIAQIPPHNGVSGLAEGKTNYAFVDYSNRRDQQDWLHATRSKGSNDRETGLVEQPSGAFLLRENNCTVSSGVREHRRDERPEYSEINSTGSVNYVVRENRGRKEFREKRTNDEELAEPENLSSRSRHRDLPMREESSTPK